MSRNSIEKANHIRLAVVLPSLAGGGRERVQLQLVREWVHSGFEVDLVLTRAVGPLLKDVPKDVAVYGIARRNSLWFPVGLLHYLRKRKPTHIFSAADDINIITIWLARLALPNACVAVSIHNHASTLYHYATGIKRLKWAVLRRLTRYALPHANAVVAVSHGVASDAESFFSLTAQPLVVYNPVDLKCFEARYEKPPALVATSTETRWVVYVGRFVAQKGLDVLIDAFRHVRTCFDAKLALVGDGPLRDSLVAQIEAVGLTEDVILAGYVDQPAAWIQSADVLVLPSRSEGLGNVLIEALACGTQIVASDCPGGPAEILDNGRYGQLVAVGDSQALATALQRALDKSFYVDPAMLMRRATEFSPERAAKRYLELLTIDKA